MADFSITFKIRFRGAYARQFGEMDPLIERLREVLATADLGARIDLVDIREVGAAIDYQSDEGDPNG